RGGAAGARPLTPRRPLSARSYIEAVALSPSGTRGLRVTSSATSIGARQTTAPLSSRRARGAGASIMERLRTCLAGVSGRVALRDSEVLHDVDLPRVQRRGQLPGLRHVDGPLERVRDGLLAALLREDLQVKRRIRTQPLSRVVAGERAALRIAEEEHGHEH